ncbi:MAG TPA: urate hydroxylase PuuD [candidate division Zixibacteria bacterium]|jgi:uncharacterized membrane protein
MELVQVLLRWVHVIFGVIWLGTVYAHAFVNMQVMSKLSGDSLKTVATEIGSRLMWWSRLGALWGWVTGILLYGMVFHMGKQVYQPEFGWGALGGILAIVPYAGVVVYELLARSNLAKNGRLFGASGFVLVACYVVLMDHLAHYSHRSVNIHIGLLFGNIMAFNLLVRSRALMKRIVSALTEGATPDPALLAEAGMRVRHNVYLSVPLLWTMLNQHTTALAGGNFGLTSQTAFVVPLLVILIGWHIVFHFLRRAGKLQAS